MTTKEAKELLVHVLMTYEPRDQYGDWDEPEPYEEAITMAIEALSADRPTGWIPVSERLPGKNGCYLVSTTGANNDIIDIAYYIGGMWHKASRIKAWMPLPEPYREDGEEE